MFDLICLLDSDADTDTVHAGLDKDPLVLIPGDCKGVEK